MTRASLGESATFLYELADHWILAGLKKVGVCCAASVHGQRSSSGHCFSLKTCHQR